MTSSNEHRKLIIRKQLFQEPETKRGRKTFVEKPIRYSKKFAEHTPIFPPFRWRLHSARYESIFYQKKLSRTSCITYWFTFSRYQMETQFHIFFKTAELARGSVFAAAACEPRAISLFLSGPCFFFGREVAGEMTTVPNTNLHQEVYGRPSPIILQGDLTFSFGRMYVATNKPYSLPSLSIFFQKVYGWPSPILLRTNFAKPLMLRYPEGPKTLSVNWQWRDTIP